MNILRDTDFLCGALLLVIATSFCWTSVSLGIGSGRSMGPGFMPLVIALAIAAIAVHLITSAALSGNKLDAKETQAAKPPRPELRGPVCVVAGILVFAVLLPNTGLMPAVFLSTVVLAAGSKPFKVTSAMSLAVFTTATTWMVFIASLELPIPVLDGVFAWNS